jgi:hypothetical protein
MTDSASLLTANTQAIVANAQSLGLSWNLRIATVDLSTTTQGVTATFDGDTVSISMVNMTGNDLAAGTRVYVIMIETQGNFIVGYAGRPVLRLRIRNPSFTLTGGIDQTISWSTLDEIVGNWYSSALPVTSFAMPESGWYSITCILSTDTGGAVNSRQMISIEPSNSAPGMGGYFYRNFWSVGESTGCVTVIVPFNKADPFTVHCRQNTAGSMNAAANLIITKVKGP